MSSDITPSSSPAAESWRSHILREFTPKVARLTLVADPDELLTEETMFVTLRERGFDLIRFEDPIEFRYAYESRYRSKWDRFLDSRDLVVILSTQSSSLITLPYDLLQAGRKLSFNLGDIFPNLSYPVVAVLDRGDLDVLYEAQKKHAPGQLGDNATKDFVLRHVFEIAPELVKQPSDLLRVLLRLHYRGQRIPAGLVKRFIQLLRQNNAFGDWPLDTLVADREAFFAFLQERWPIFLDRVAAKETSGLPLNASAQGGVCEDGMPYGLSIKGPIELPFDHHDIRVYIDNLFVEGLLHCVPHDHADALSKTWVGIGVRTAPIQDRSRRLSKLIDSLEASIPAEDAKHTEWFHFARGWAELKVMSSDEDWGLSEAGLPKIKELTQKVDERFMAWTQRRYAGLIQLPPNPPVMLHHVPRFLANSISSPHHSSPEPKLALVVIDGLAMDQWLVVREALASKQPGLRFREQAVFAWIPSLTSVSRQATFAGKAPIFFPNSIHTTDKEPALWAQFWADQGLTANEVVYLKGLGDGSLEVVSEALSHPKARVAGLVVDKVDKILHGMQMGTAGMHNQVSQWAKQPYLNTLLNLLLDRGFRIFLTSDHGNVEAEGCGRPSEGAAADLRGERVRVYTDAALRGEVKQKFPDAMEWNPVGLPEDYLALLAPARKAFVQEMQRTVCHGGISVEELIVPLVEIERRTEC
ncbi:BREX-3 system phosphatase PglZ [Desulfosoma caldarium]|uniref:PglZ domain-containing protein n=1 Tax=Desulfosoma caldarium TaxID=610254 RepID=A0A3N1ULS4_9BACT|nr:BREX-3 system phosphatase PglZ [Desulfosoma caldarium]ROQ92175.1 PglZ domain-containing protein [Desulfosoma caldarium]